jgi:hypothetical protein
MIGGFTPQPANLGACGLFVTNATLVAPSFIDSSGIRFWSVTLPAASSLVHFQLGLQAVFQVTGSPLPTFSNGLRVTIGGAL